LFEQPAALESQPYHKKTKVIGLSNAAVSNAEIIQYQIRWAKGNEWSIHVYTYNRNHRKVGIVPVLHSAPLRLAP
jgi:hypothetical protein